MNESPAKHKSHTTNPEIIHECSQKDDIQKIKKILYGNGEVGILEDIRNIKKDIQEIKEIIMKKDSIFWKIATPAITIIYNLMIMGIAFMVYGVINK